MKSESNRPKPARGNDALTSLQELQGRFDSSRGFDFERRASSGGSGDGGADAWDLWLHNLEYATLAIAGESGELANIIKKARRVVWTSGGHRLDTKAVQSELADILAYVLKCANVGGWDLEVAYLEKMSDNALRFPPRTQPGAGRVVTVCGPPGAGKTTTVRHLEGQAATYVEEAASNPYLGDGGKPTSAVASQRWFLDRLAEFIAAAPRGRDLILEQDPAAVVKVYARGFLAEAQIDAPGYRSLLRDLVEVEERLADWRGLRRIVILDAPTDVLRARIAGRPAPLMPRRELLERWRDGFRTFAAAIPDAVVVRTDNLSVEETVEVVRGVLT